MLSQSFQLILSDLRARSQWDARQDLWQRLRFEGVRRKRPFAHAADMHYPLADSIIDKLKPFYVQQVFAQDTIAHFAALDDTHDPHAIQAARWFDWHLRQSNFEHAIILLADKLLGSGTAMLMPRWDPAAKSLDWRVVEAPQTIVPPATRTLREADRVTRIHACSVPEYQRRTHYQQDPALLLRIRGQGTEPGRVPLEESKLLRAGVTHAEDPDLIVLWDVWTRDLRGAWSCEVISPLAPESPIRPRCGLPYQHGELPLIDFRSELVDDSFYSARGITELIGMFQTALVKLWNEKLDYMSFVNRPVFTRTAASANAGALRFEPGEILPFGIARLEMGAPPVSFDQEMIHTRMLAEYRIGMPDFGVGQRINTTERRTAREIEQVSMTMQQVADIRARLFRMSLRCALRQAFSLLCQYAPEALRYFEGNRRHTLQEAALGAHYDIQPAGNPDSWNRIARMEKAVLRKQLFADSPHIDQVELDRSILELDDPKLVARLIREPANPPEATAHRPKVRRFSTTPKAVAATLTGAMNHDAMDE